MCSIVYVWLQLEQSLKLSSGELSGDDVGQKSLVQQNIELRKKLDEEHSNYKRKLQAYQDGQQRQAQLVQKLQAKVRGDGSLSMVRVATVIDPVFTGIAIQEKMR
mgnify:CR=1 FL=1